MAGIMTFDRTDSRLGLLPLPPNSGLPEFGALSWPKSDKSDFGWERGGVRGQGLSIVLYPPHPNPLPKRGEGAHRNRSAAATTLPIDLPNASSRPSCVVPKRAGPDRI